MANDTEIKFTSVEFSNYKAFRRFSLQIQHMNVLVGPNNCGKSTIIRAFRIAEVGLRAAGSRNAGRVPGPSGQETWGYRIPDRHLPVSLENVHTDYEETDSSIRFRCSNGNCLHLFFPKEGGCLLLPEGPDGSIRTAGRIRSGFPRIQTIPELGPLEDEEFILAEETVRQGLSTHRACRHFRNYWRLYPDGFDGFAALVARSWPGMQVELPETNLADRRLTMFCREDRMTREIYWSGFGFQVWCQLLTHISRSNTADVLVVDEPEVYLHPDVQRQLVGILREAGPDIVAASHSTEIIGESDPSEVVVVDKIKRTASRLREIEEVQTAISSIGSLHNVTLTQLARTKRLLFVESRDDFRLIGRFARLLGRDRLSTGNDITVAESGGFSAWQKAVAAAWAFEKTLGGKFQMGIVLDRDFLCDEEIAEIVAELEGHFVPAHIHERKEIENYLLDPVVLERAIDRFLKGREARTGEVGELTDTVEDILDEITNNSKADVQAQYVAKRIAYFRRTGKDDATAATEALAWVEHRWDSLETRLRIVPGKEVLGAVRFQLQERYAVTLTDHRIVSAFHRDEIPEDLRRLISALDEFRVEAASVGTASGDHHS